MLASISNKYDCKAMPIELSHEGTWVKKHTHNQKNYKKKNCKKYKINKKKICSIKWIKIKKKTFLNKKETKIN